MKEIINKMELLSLIKDMLLTAESINTEDALVLISFLDSCILSFNDIKQIIIVKLWNEYLKNNPRINIQDYDKNLKKYKME